MSVYKIFIRADQVYSKPVEYILSIFSRNHHVSLLVVKEKSEAGLIIDHSDPENSVPVAVDFYNDLILNHIYNHRHYFRKECLILTNDNKVDFLATIFYMINCFQEYETEKEAYDKFGRFQFEKTYQHLYNNIEDNLIQKLFERFSEEYLKGLKIRHFKTKVFVSHDIDTIYGSLFQDGLWALRRGRLDVIFRLIINTFLLRPNWKNMDKIMKINDEYDLKSTFFWLACKGKGVQGIMNADYRANRLSSLKKKISSNGHFNGMHKSCTEYSLNEELEILPIENHSNRYHFLKFQVPGQWEELNDSKIKMDASLGFAERYGFRNNYGLPFRPYNIRTGTSYDFVEVPLNLMDGTFHRYLKIPVNETAGRIIGFFEKNSMNSVISLLWHNTYFSSFKYHGYLQEYLKILKYLYESRIEAVTQAEIIKEF